MRMKTLKVDYASMTKYIIVGTIVRHADELSFGKVKPSKLKGLNVLYPPDKLKNSCPSSIGNFCKPQTKVSLLL